MNSNTIKPFLNLLMFALRNNVPGDPFESNKDTIRTLVEQSISLFRCGASADSKGGRASRSFKESCLDRAINSMEESCKPFGTTDRKDIEKIIGQL